MDIFVSLSGNALSHNKFKPDQSHEYRLKICISFNAIICENPSPTDQSRHLFGAEVGRMNYKSHISFETLPSLSSRSCEEIGSTEIHGH